MSRIRRSRGGLGGRLGLVAVGRRIRRPEMPAASRAHPELIGCPRHARTRIAHVHLRAAAHAANLEIALGSCARFYNIGPVIPAIVLAAGRSSRMGRAKATLPLDDSDTFLTRIVRTFLEAGVDDVVVVVGTRSGRDRLGVLREWSAGALRGQSRLRPRTVVVAGRGSWRRRSARRVGDARDAGRRAAGDGGHGARGARRATAARTRRWCVPPQAAGTAIHC